MAYLLRNGDYVPDETGGFKKAEGTDELLERAVFKLRARRGQFPLMPNLGSRLYLLSREAPAARRSAAEQYVREALRDETQLQITTVSLTQKSEELFLDVTAVYGDREISFGLNV